MMLRKLTFICSIITLYILVIGALAYMLYMSLLPFPPLLLASEPAAVQQAKTAPQTKKIVSGIPIRIVIEDEGINLAIDKGTYNDHTDTWTLHDSRAQFAAMTVQPNNQKGMTFIYGHGTDAVFGEMGSSPPPKGTVAKIYTKNKKVFIYRLQSVHSTHPNDTSIFKKMHTGQPRLVIQTCTGPFSEWRTMFTFAFEKVKSAH